MFGLSLPRLLIGLVAVGGFGLLAGAVVRHAELAGLVDHGPDDLNRLAGRMRVKMHAVREYETGRIDLATAAGRFADADLTDPRRLADLREQLGETPDEKTFARMVLEHVAGNDSALPERPVVLGRAAAEFERVYRSSPGHGWPVVK